MTDSSLHHSYEQLEAIVVSAAEIGRPNARWRLKRGDTHCTSNCNSPWEPVTRLASLWERSAGLWGADWTGMEGRRGAEVGAMQGRAK